MKITGKELEEKNYYLGLWNSQEYLLMETIWKMRQSIDNPYTVIRKKIHEMEDFFYMKEKAYYTETKLGPMTKDYLILLLADALEELHKVVIVENILTLYGHVDPKIKNPAIARYGKAIDQIKNFKIDETLPIKLASFLTEERMEEEIESVQRELVEFGFLDIASTIVEDTKREMNQKGRKENQKTIGKKL